VRRLVAFVLLAAGCGTEAPPAGATRDVTDARGKTVRIPLRPERIVSIAPSATELLFAVGAGPQVAGVTTYCTWPEEAGGKPKIGSIVLDPEALLALRPDLIVTAHAITRRTTTDLEAKGYAVFATDADTLEGIAVMLRRLGDAVGRKEEGARAADALLARIAKVRAEPGPTVYFEHSVDPLGTAGPATYTGDAIRRAGGRNVFDGGWRLIDWESVLAADPEVILVAHDRRDGLERRAGWAGLRAVKAGRVHFVKKEHFVYPTPRLAEGLEEAHRILRAKTP
jgi:iron complex transport system substrate-binding protein